MDAQTHRFATLIEKIRALVGEDAMPEQHHEAVALSQTVLHETLGDRHPLMKTFQSTVEKYDWSKASGACRTLITLYEQGLLVSPRFQIAKELEEDIIDAAERQLREAGRDSDKSRRQLRLAVAAFLCGVSLEDALRRICDKHGLEYEFAKTSIAKLQSALYSPSKGVEIITKSENAQIGAWGQTRNNADHGNFSQISVGELQSMIIGVRAFIDKYLP